MTFAACFDALIEQGIVEFFALQSVFPPALRCNS